MCWAFPPLALKSKHGKTDTIYTRYKGHALLASIRFLWNATRGHRLAPWRSEYLRWRVETYSGMPAEQLTIKDILVFFWTSRWEFLSYLAWTDRLYREVHKRV